MFAKTIGPTPVPGDERQLQRKPDRGQELLVHYPRSNTIISILPEQSRSDEIAAAAKFPASMATAARRVLPRRSAARAIEVGLEPNAAAAVIIAASGLGLVAYLWSTILL